MTSGPVVAMELMGDEAVAGWRRLLGPTDAGVARSEAAGSVRAQYGTDGTRNAGHGSDSLASAARVHTHTHTAQPSWPPLPGYTHTHTALTPWPSAVTTKDPHPTGCLCVCGWLVGIIHAHTHTHTFSAAWVVVVPTCPLNG